MNGELETVEAFDLFMEPMREFMFANTRKEELNAIINISKYSPIHWKKFPILLLLRHSYFLN